MNNRILKWNFVFQYGYVLTNIINSIILLPLYLQNIDQSTLGIWLATGNILAWMTLADPGVGDVLQQKIAELRGKKLFGEVGKTIGSGFIASALLLVISVAAGFLFYFLIGVIIDKDIAQYPNLEVALILTVIATGLSLVSFSMSGINQGLHNSAQVAIAALVANVVFLVFNIFFLYLGLGVISIAFANLIRTIFINVYNMISMHRHIIREKLRVIYDLAHFKKFIRIFSFTSASRIIGGFTASMDMIILGRFIAPHLITIFEINKRPINMTGSMIGRHSVALMPLVSHAKGSQDHQSIIKLISQQFRFYSYVALFTSLLFWLVYPDLITAWTGAGHYAGDTIVHLLILNFFFGLISYFMANMGYALGDIKRNSIINIVKGIVLAPLLIWSAKEFAITGMLVVTLSATLVIDLAFFTWRLYKLGYLQTSLVKDLFSKWLIIVPASLLVFWFCREIANSWLPANFHLYKVVLAGGIFTVSFVLLLLLADAYILEMARKLRDRYLLTPYNKILAAFSAANN
jgi:O-antigen/teichoic acid export membrane protein